MSDEIMKELWKIKDNIAREHGYDVRRLSHISKRGRGPRITKVDLLAARGRADQANSVDRKLDNELPRP